VPRAEQRAPVASHPRVLPAVAVALGALTLLVGLGADIPLSILVHVSSPLETIQAAPAVAFTCVGAFVAARQPRNLIGWTLLGAGVFSVLTGFGSAYSVADYRLHDGSLPFGPVAVLAQPSWAPAIVCMVVSGLAFPDGRMLVGRTRWVVRGLLAVGAVWMAGVYSIAGNAIAGHHIVVTANGTLTQFTHPTGAWAWWGVAQVVFFSVVALSVVFWIVDQAVQYRSLGEERRAQQKWLVSGTLLFVVGGVLSIAFASGTSDLGRAVSDVGTALLAALPITIGIGISRFRLYDIDRVASRTISYLLVTGLVVGVYIGAVSLTTKALALSSSVGVAASTLAAVALFNPLRRRLQRAVDRRFNRARYDAEATVAAFSGRLRELVDADQVRDELLGVVTRTFEPSGTTVWIAGKGVG
jgi:hypothetical protein